MALSEEAKEARRQYIRNWRKKHPEKTKEYNDNHWEHVAKRMKAEEDREND